MKKLLVLSVIVLTTIFQSFAQKPFPIPNKEVRQWAAGDTLSVKLEGDSVKIITTKDFISFNKDLTVNGDSLLTKTRVNTLIGDSIGDNLVNYYTTSEVDNLINDSLNLAVRLVDIDQIVNGEKTFTDTLTVDKVLKVNSIYTTNSLPLLTYDGTTIEIKNYAGGNWIHSNSYSNGFRTFDGEEFFTSDVSNNTIKAHGGSDMISGNSTEVLYRGRDGLDLIKSNTDVVEYRGYDGREFIEVTDTTTYIKGYDGKSMIWVQVDSTSIYNASGTNKALVLKSDTIFARQPIKTDSVIYSLGIYGEIIADSVVTAQTVVDSTWTKITAFNLVGNSSFVTAVADSLVIQRTGMYEVQFNFATCVDVKDITTTLAVYKNGVKTKLIDCAWVDKDLGTFNLNASRLLSLTAGDVLDCRIYHTDIDNADITFKFGSLSVKYISK